MKTGDKTGRIVFIGGTNPAWKMNGQPHLKVYVAERKDVTKQGHVRLVIPMQDAHELLKEIIDRMQETDVDDWGMDIPAEYFELEFWGDVKNLVSEDTT